MTRLVRGSFLILLCFPICFWPTQGRAQETGTIAGRVTKSASGAPLSGAQVFIEGGSVGTLTDAEGRYRLPSVPQGTHNLVVVHLGFRQQSRELTLGPGQSLVVGFSLQVTVIALDEIVVTATGERRRVELGNAIANIQAPEIVESAPVTNAFDLLQARAPGVQVLNTGGGAGIGSRIRIRGSNSLSLSNEPIVYLDGVRIETGYREWLGLAGQDLSRLNDLNPEEIESIEIVKGPSAATLYGTKAANGVIRITTKKGRPGPPRWTFYAEGGAIRDPYEYPDNYKAFDASGNRCTLDSQVAGTCQLATVSHYQPLEDERFTFMGTGWRQQYGLTVSGGADRVNYFVSGEWEEEVGPYELKPLYQRRLDSLGFDVKETTKRPQQLQKMSLRANLSIDVTDNAVFSLNTGWVGSTTSLTRNDNTVGSAIRLGYYGGAVRPETDEYDNSIWYGAYSPELNFAEDLSQEVGRFTTAARLSWSPLSWLQLRALAGMDRTQQDEVDHLPPNLWSFHPSYRTGYRFVGGRRILQQTVDLGATGSFNLSPSLASETSVGAQFLREYLHQSYVWGMDLPVGTESVTGLGDHRGNEGTEESRTLGVFVEERLSWNDRLFVTGAVRLDDNSSFGKDFDAIVYPKFSVSWMASDESWFPRVPGLDELRVRGAWGWSGLQPPVEAALLSFSPKTVDTEGGATSGVVVGTFGNPDLKPETSRELESGFDADFLGGRLGLEFTYYKKKSKNALLLRPLIPSAGAAQARWENLGSVENWGLEAGVTAVPVASRAFEWSLSLLGSVNHNKVLSFGEGVEPPHESFREGYPGGSHWGYPIESFEDSNGDGILTTDEVVIGEEERFLGPQMPAEEMTLRNVFTLWDRVQFSFLLDYRGGFAKSNGTLSQRCVLDYCQAAWDPETPLREQARRVAQVLLKNPWSYVEKVDFIKLREVGVTLTAPDTWATRAGAERLSLTLTGRNLAIWSDYTGIDPEANSLGIGSGTYSDQGWTSWDYLNQPPFRYWTAKIHVTF